MTLAKLPTVGDKGTKETISNSKAGPLEEEWLYDPTYKTCDLKFVMSKRNAGTNVDQMLKEWLTIGCPNLRPITWAHTNP